MIKWPDRPSRQTKPLQKTLLSPLRALRKLRHAALAVAIIFVAGCQMTAPARPQIEPYAHVGLRNPVFSPDGSTIAYDYYYKDGSLTTLWRVGLLDARSRDRVGTLPLPEQVHWRKPRFTPDGNRLVLISECYHECEPAEYYGENVWEFEFSSGELKKIYSHRQDVAVTDAYYDEHWGGYVLHLSEYWRARNRVSVRINETVVLLKDGQEEILFPDQITLPPGTQFQAADATRVYARTPFGHAEPITPFRKDAPFLARLEKTIIFAKYRGLKANIRELEREFKKYKTQYSTIRPGVFWRDGDQFQVAKGLNPLHDGEKFEIAQTHMIRGIKNDGPYVYVVNQGRKEGEFVQHTRPAFKSNLSQAHFYKFIDGEFKFLQKFEFSLLKSLNISDNGEIAIDLSFRWEEARHHGGDYLLTFYNMSTGDRSDVDLGSLVFMKIQEQLADSNGKLPVE